MPDHEVIVSHPGSAIPHVGTYRRVLPVSLERMYENTLDWEHLPFVHDSSFQNISCQDAGAWGWRAEIVDARGRPSVIELCLDRRCRRWITRTLSGANAGAEIWTHAFPIEQRRVDIVVDFFVPDVPPASRDKVGNAYAQTYQRLYDEDVKMMVERQARLDQRIPAGGAAGPVDLGPRSELQLPCRVQFGGRDFTLAEDAGELLAYPELCPHQLGSLADLPLEAGGVATCSWHGYRFDVRTGDCLSGQSCRLTQLPVVAERDGRVWLDSAH